MKITGGSFGARGSAYVARHVFAVEGATKRDYRPVEISSVAVRVAKTRSFGMLGFIVGAILFTIIGLFILGPIGAMIGLVISIAGSFYTSSANIVDVTFADGRTLTAEGTERSIKKLIKFADR